MKKTNVNTHKPEDCCVSCGRYNAPGDDISVATMLCPDGRVLTAEYCRKCYREGRLLEHSRRMIDGPLFVLDPGEGRE